MSPSACVWQRLQAEVIRPGLCTHCGTCAGLSQGALVMQPTERGPLPHSVGDGPVLLPELAYAACPGKGLDYPALNRSVFGSEPDNWLIGHWRRIAIGYATDPAIRRAAASGGVITRTLLYLLESGRIDGAVVVRQGYPQPWLAEPLIAATADEIRAASQSVYAPIPVNALLDRMERFDGVLAYAGLPDQVAALRTLQAARHPAARKVRYVLGPYTGTNMYAAAIESYLRANGVHSAEEVVELRYRAGEWPGHLLIRTRDGRELRAEKFYYNYLIPFYITQSTLYSVDFTNELTDISVGDAWHPRYEAQGGGFSVVVARSAAGQELLDEMQEAGALHLEDADLPSALAMHGHMLDFKKRGSFIRIAWRAARGLPVPDYGYRPATIPLSRQLVEVVIASLFALCGTRAARRLAELIPIQVLGPAFNTLRKAWKALSKPAKRKGLLNVQFITTPKGGQPMPNHPNKSALDQALERTRAELAHWRRREWNFAGVGAHWDATEDYDDINAETYSYFRRFVDGLRLSNLPDGAHVLDICARTGNGTLYFHQHGKVGSAVCADVSAKMGDICRQRLEEGGVEDFAWLQVFDYALPLRSCEFDAVLCFESAEHFPHPERLVAELGRVTKPGGTLILTTPNVLWEPVHALAAITGLHHSEGPHRFIGYRRLLRMVKDAGFVIEQAETTVLVPGGPQALVKAGEWMEQRTRSTLMPLLGLRRVLVCRKRG
ncbi:MAG: Coenzyme F420 hydrogenase/dehydrogenase, beta subunit C-terminal domain [Chloroflexota bacterium]|nr:Coenzyme F420 hydrogenase/dehydrogenase, beta subunit C-terminal domain [Chloroflexota bacterium]